MSKPLPDQSALIQRQVERVRAIARHCGYAVAVHGSQQRDLDLIAVPWTDGAVGNRALVETLMERGPFALGETVEKPHGRIGYVLHGVPGNVGVKYIDLSVTPRTGDIYGTCNVCWEREQLPVSAPDLREEARRRHGGALLVRPGDITVTRNRDSNASDESQRGMEADDGNH